MKARKKLLIASCLLLAGICCFFLWFHENQAAPMPQPSLWGGCYEDDFILRLSAPENGTIYYTTDGSVPTTASQKYTEGIYVKNRSGEPNRYASLQNIVEDWKNYTPDPALVEKGTVIRAVFVNDSGISSDVLTQTYFVGITPPERGYILSLVFENDDLFGDDGIYITGKEYDAWYLSGGSEEEKPKPNFKKEVEIPVIAELMDAHGDVMNQTVGLRIQGKGSRRYAQKRFTLEARTEYSGSEFFETALFDGVVTHSVMVKESHTDAMIRDLVSERAVTTQKSIPVRVYLNGEFFYDSYLLERYDTNYFRQYYGIDNRVLVKNGITDKKSAARMKIDEYGEFMFWVETTDFSDPEQWEGLCETADVQSYIDYMAINYFMCNIDFGDSYNYVLWRSPYEGKGTFADGRWRWCIYDIEGLKWASSDPSRGTAEEINMFSLSGSADPRKNEPTFGVHKALKRNPEYCRRFVLSFMDIYNNNFTAEATDAVLEKYGLSPEWYGGYFRNRIPYATKHIAEEFGLTGSLETVTVTCDHPEMGQVTLGTSQIDLSDGSWEGKYFTDYPITITAVPKDGYQFLGWKGDADEASSTLTIPVDGGIHLEAVFAELE